MASARGLVVRVQQFDNAAVQILGRAAAMVMWIVVYHDQINQTNRGHVTFDWEGSSLRPRFESRYDRINIDTLLPLSDQSSS